MGIGFATDEEVEEIEKELTNPLFVGPESLLPTQRAFLNGFIKRGTLRGAMQVTGINKFYHYVWLNDYPEYQAAFAQIERAVRGSAIEKIERRAVDGYFEHLSYMGKVTGDKVRRYSDTLAKAYLSAHDPRYRDGGITVQVGPQSLAITYPTGENSLSIEGQQAEEPKKINQQSHNSSNE